MPPLRNHYATLDLPAFASEEAVRSAYRKLARKFHPDLNNGEKSAEERFKAVNEAYETLSSPEKKRLYDDALQQILKPRTGQAASGKASEKKPPPSASTAKPADSRAQPPPKKPPSEPARQAASAAAPGKPAAQTVGINELFESFLKKAAAPPPAAGNKKSAGGAKAAPRRGDDITVETAILPHEAESGVIKPVHAQHVEICRRCSGSGKLNGTMCAGCNGQKSMTRTQKIEVRIPPGVKTGSKVRVAGEGGRGRDGGEPGDLYLLIKVGVDPALRVEGADVHYTAAVSIPVAVLGGEIDVPTLEGTVKLAIPPRTPHGKTLRMKGMGAATGNGRGDQLVTVSLTMPAKLSPKEQALYQALADLQTNG